MPPIQTINIASGILRRGHQILMAHRTLQRKNYPDCWSFPGGHVEANETTEQALIRELTEEIYISANKWTFIQKIVVRTTDSTVMFHLFTVDKWKGTPQNVGDEHTELRWVTLEQARALKPLALAEYQDVFSRLAG